ncbi:hypothetical protein FRX31_025246 [Thalictrum thalictroides]|uniref:Uncharacterized protein n=1 Tax=Thalictrum thalictroides TaxID=46969 RepID=A0A7J6VKN0_THATH|nr:hypothetical protein FRX31_025246 [Thalictrum thalictroides]
MKLYLQTEIESVLKIGTNNGLIDRLGLSVPFKKKNVQHYIWEKPDPRWLKLDYDGALNDQGTGYGGLIRNEDGYVLLAYIGCSKTNSVIIQELNVIYYGLKEVVQIGATNLLVASLLIS